LLERRTDIGPLIILIIIIIIIIIGTCFSVLYYTSLPEWTKKSAGLSPVFLNVSTI